MPQADQVKAMFDDIAKRYDLMNRIMTMGIDKRWRAEAVRQARVTPEAHVVDVCCGTGDLSFALARAGSGTVTGVDFSPNMLAHARRRAAIAADDDPAQNVSFVEGDALHLPFDDDSVDAITVGFGIRNVSSIDAAFREFVRVVKPGGRVVCLDITRPQTAFMRMFYGLWFDRVVPVLGSLIGGSKHAYTYLPESTKKFPEPRKLAAMMANAGLVGIRYRRYAGGIIALHSASISSVVTKDNADKTASAKVRA